MPIVSTSGAAATVAYVVWPKTVVRAVLVAVPEAVAMGFAALAVPAMKLKGVEPPAKFSLHVVR